MICRVLLVALCVYACSAEEEFIEEAAGEMSMVGNATLPVGYVPVYVRADEGGRHFSAGSLTMRLQGYRGGW